MDLDLEAASASPSPLLKKEPRWGPGIRRQTPTIYRVTTGSLSEYTKATYQNRINDFLAFYKITDSQGIEPLPYLQTHQIDGYGLCASFEGY